MAAPPSSDPDYDKRGEKRRRESGSAPIALALAPLSQTATPRIIETVIFSGYEIYSDHTSPYPLDESIVSGPPGPLALEKRSLAKASNGGRLPSSIAPGKTKNKTSKKGSVGPGGEEAGQKGKLVSVKSFSPELLPGVDVSRRGGGGADVLEAQEDSRMSPELEAEEDSPMELGTKPPIEDTPELPTSNPPEDEPQHDDPQVDSLQLTEEIPVHEPQLPEDISLHNHQLPEDIPFHEPHLSEDISFHEPPLPPAPNTFPSLEANLSQRLPIEPPQRGHGGRFLSKPPGESVKSRRQLLAKASREAELQANPRPPRPTAGRDHSERDRMEKEAAGEKVALLQNGASMTTKRLFICDGCFKYMVQPAAHTAHIKVCGFKSPPGRKVYQRGAHIIWEIDGVDAKLYCQNLCLFAKLFIEHKYMFFDVEGFMFYVLTDATPSFDYVIGYFSKEKVSYDDYNLACIVTFPPYQKKGYGTLLIEFSYELARRKSATAGTPERPLSELGEKGYLAYWTGVIVRYFRAVFELGGEPPPLASLGRIPVDEDEEARRKRNRRSRGWDGELPVPSSTALASTTLTLRRNSGGTASASLVETRPTVSKDFVFPTTLTEVADATNLRVEDVAFTLVECGLAQWRRKRAVHDTEENDVGLELEEVVISSELVEEIAVKKGVRDRTMMDLQHVLL